MDRPDASPAGRPRSWLRHSFALGALVSAALLAVVYFEVDFGRTWRILTAIDAARLPVPLAIILAIQWLRALRWRLLFPPGQRPGVLHAWRVMCIGIMANNLLPARGGDLLRCWLIKTDRAGSSASIGLGTLAIEKMQDGLALVLIVLVSILFWTPPTWLNRLAIGGAAALGIGFAVVFVLAIFPLHFQRGIERAGRWVRFENVGRWAGAKFHKFSQGLHGVKSPWQVVTTAPLTLLVWLAEGGLVWGAAFALGIRLGIVESLVCAAILSLAMVIPSAPAAVGTYEMALTNALGLFAIGADRGLAITLAMHACDFSMALVVGVICLILNRTSFRKVLHPGAPPQ